MYHHEWHFDSMYYRIVLVPIVFAAEGDGFFWIGRSVLLFVLFVALLGIVVVTLLKLMIELGQVGWTR